MQLSVSNNKIIFNELTTFKNGNNFLNGGYSETYTTTISKNPINNQYHVNHVYLMTGPVLLHVTGTITKDMTDKILYYSFNNELNTEKSERSALPYTIAIPANPTTYIDNINYYMFLPYTEQYPWYELYIKTHDSINNWTSYSTTTFNITFTFYKL